MTRSRAILGIALSIVANGLLVAVVYIGIGMAPLDLFEPLADPLRLDQFPQPELLLTRIRSAIQLALVAAVLLAAFVGLVWLVLCALSRPATPQEAAGKSVLWWLLAALALVVPAAAAAGVLYQVRSVFMLEALWLASAVIGFAAMLLAYWLVGTWRFTPRLFRHAVPLS